MQSIVRKASWVLLVLRTALVWFGLGTALRMLLALPRLAGAQRSLSVIYESLGVLRFRRPYRGRRVVWPCPDIGYVWEIFAEHCYTSPPGMEIAEDDVVVDAGANVGVFSVFAALNAPRGRVVAIEPSRSRFRGLQQNLAANSLTNVTPIQAALATEDGEGVLWSASVGSGSDSLIRSEISGGTEPVRLISPESLLGQFGLDHVDLLKLDIEGGEYALLAGDLAWLQRVRRVAAEVHGDYGTPETAIAALERAGFSVTATPTERTQADWQVWAIRN